MNNEIGAGSAAPFHAPRYVGYRSYSYLEAGVDYPTFGLAPEEGREPVYDSGLDPEQRERVVRIMREHVVVSLHDHPHLFPADMGEVHAYMRSGREHTNYRGLAQSGLTVVFDNLMDGMACITSESGWKWTDLIHDLGMRQCDIAHQDFARVVRSVDDILDVKSSGQVGIVLALEASTAIENEVDRIDVLYGFGVRQMGIAYSESNTLGTGLKERTDGGLTSFGRRAVARMNALGIAIDVSHSSDRTCLDTFEASSAPVLITHAGARGVWNTPRMKPDSVLRACAESGGVIGIESAPHTTQSPRRPRHDIDSVMDHFEYCVDVMGIDAVAFGPDTLYGDHVALHKAMAKNFSIAEAHGGPTYEPVPYVAGMENPTECFFNVVGWLVKHGYSDVDIVKVLGGNAMRVLRQIW